MIRLIGLDMDGTTLNDKKEISEKNAKAIQAALDAGIEVAFVTGRPLHGIEPDMLKFRNMRYLITSNGAATVRLSDQTFIHGSWLDSDIAEYGIRCALQESVIYTLFYQGYGYADPQTYEKLIKAYEGTVLDAYMKMSRRPAEDIFEIAKKTELENFWVIADDEAQRDRMADVFRQHTNANIIKQVKRDVEMVSPKADKGNELLLLGQHLGIEPHEIMAIGDGMNDIGMLRAAGHSVAMENARSEVKAAANMLTSTNNEDGVATAIYGVLEQKPYK